jgi:hypothetical protein
MFLIKLAKSVNTSYCQEAVSLNAITDRIPPPKILILWLDRSESRLSNFMAIQAIIRTGISIQTAETKKPPPKML